MLKASGKYGLSTRGPSFNNVLVDNRQNPVLASFLAALIDCPIQVTHPRYLYNHLHHHHHLIYTDPFT